MKILDFYTKLNSMHEKDYIENFLTYSVSLVLAGVKPAVTIAINKSNIKLFKSWCHFGEDFLDNMCLDYIELRRTNNSMIIMIYDNNILENELSNKSSKDFLVELGYPSDINTYEYLKMLKSRYELYNCPHELGLFLGIPIEDVKDFMECTPKKCLLCGYWKVYNNLKEAKNIFDKYDMVKAFTIEKIMKGNLSHEVALNIKNSFYTLEGAN